MRNRVLALLAAGAILAASALPALADNGDTPCLKGNHGLVQNGKTIMVNSNGQNANDSRGGVWVDCGS